MTFIDEADSSLVVKTRLIVEIEHMGRPQTSHYKINGRLSLGFNPVMVGIILMAMPMNAGGECADDPGKKRDECKDDDPECSMASKWQLQNANIANEHEFKADYVGKKNGAVIPPEIKRV